MSKSSAATAALHVLVVAEVAHTVRSYHHDPAAESYGIEAAHALSEPPGKVFKTLVAHTDLARDKGLVVGIVPVDRHLDLKALARAAGAKKATMADPTVVQRTTGYVLGGVSPLGQKRALPTFLDQSAEDWETILVSGGQRGLDVELAPQDLLRLTAGRLAAIARD